MKYLALTTALVMASPAVAEKFEEVLPENVCWYNDIAYGLGSHNPTISAQFRGAAPAGHNTGYGQFCVLNAGLPTWVYMDYDHEAERWIVTAMPLVIE